MQTRNDVYHGMRTGQISQKHGEALLTYHHNGGRMPISHRFDNGYIWFLDRSTVYKELRRMGFTWSRSFGWRIL